MKYYTLSFKNKILLALILILTMCLAVICGAALFDEEKSITADAANIFIK